MTVSHGHYHYVRELLDSILRYWSAPFELVIVDNLASNVFQSLVGEYEAILMNRGASLVIRQFDKPKSFSVGNNYAIREASYEHLFIINPDCKFVDDSVYKWFKKHSARLDYELIYPKLLNSDGTKQQSYNEWPSLPNQLYRLARAKLDLPTGQPQNREDWYFASAIMTSKKLFSSLNGFDELFPLYCEDVDLCYKAGLLDIPCTYVEEVQMVHHLGGEAKHKHLKKAVLSNIIWRYVRLRNYVNIRLLGKRYSEKQY